ncbi:hypothetical protein NC651_022509 [Populus alba x Populus x berolinensis]|nr:hypothetical protein NC651_022509 [Populus alba x Populus x berolinensis]
MAEDEGWVLLQLATRKDWWNPSSMEDNSGEGPRPLKVTFSGPAKHWTDAIPIGNGRLGAMIWGGVASETLQLNVSSSNRRNACREHGRRPVLTPRPSSG